MFKKYLCSGLIVSTLLTTSALYSQNVAINNSGSTAYASAILDLSNNNTAGTVGFLPPYATLTALTTFGLSGTAAQSNGILVYCTGLSAVPRGLYYWDNTAGNWVSVGGAASANNGLSLAGNIAQLGDPTTAAFPTANKFSVGREVTENGFPMIFDVGDGSTGNNAGNWSIQNNVGANKNPAFFVGYNANGNPAVEIGNAAAPATILFNVQAAAAPAAQANGSSINLYGQNATAGGGIGGKILIASGLSTGNNSGANIILQPSPLSGTGAANGGLAVGYWGTAPNASAVVDMTNTNGAGVYGNKGMLIPEINSPVNTTAAINAIIPGAATGLLVFNVGTGCFLYYAGAAFGWMEMYCPCNAPPALTTAGISGCTSVVAGATAVTYAIVAPQPGVSYNWSVNNTNGTVTPTTFGTSVTVNWSALATGNSNVVVTANNSCGANTVNYPVTILSTTATGPAGNIAIPSGSVGPYSVPLIAGATYAWSFTSGAGTFTAPTANSTNVTFTSANGSSNQAIIKCVITLPGGCGSGTATYTQTFHGTAFNNSTAGGPYLFNVPSGITILTVALNGAQGGECFDNNANFGTQGFGATVNATLTITTQTAYNIYLGGSGGNPPNSFSGGAGGSGGNGGDEAGGIGSGNANCNWANFSGYGSGGGGGGASSVRVGTTRELVAGGGGGGGGNQSQGGGGGGIGAGQGAQGGGNDGSVRGTGGNPGAAVAGGAAVTGGQAGCTLATNAAGGIGIGSAGLVASANSFFGCLYGGGGGGGGGWYAGSGGVGGGGGGGWSALGAGAGFTFAITSVVANNNAAAGSCTITY